MLTESKAWEVDTLRGHTNNVSCVMFHARQVRGEGFMTHAGTLSTSLQGHCTEVSTPDAAHQSSM